MAEVNLLARYPKTRRNLAARKQGQAGAREISRLFGKEYFDGAREQGYGGYRYDGRWKPIAEDIVRHFSLKPGDRVLDVGCAKGFLMHDLTEAMPGLEVWGLDISEYALTHHHPGLHGRLVRGTAAALPFPPNSFQAALAINVIHNLPRLQCLDALRDLQRVAPGRAYVQVDAYRNEAERDIFLDWVLTAETFGTPAMWEKMFDEAGYTGGYHWTILETDPEAIPQASSHEDAEPRRHDV